MRNRDPARAFTLIEILITIAILAILTVVAFASIQTAYAQAKKARRITDLRSIQHALDEYASDNGAYPVSTKSGADWDTQCGLSTGYPGGNLPSQQIIPGLVPTYLSTMPTDPEMNTSRTANGLIGTCCYMYRSDGKDYKLVDANCSTANYADPEFKALGMIDPERPGPNMPSFAIAIWTPAAMKW